MSKEIEMFSLKPRVDIYTFLIICQYISLDIEGKGAPLSRFKASFLCGRNMSSALHRNIPLVIQMLLF